MYFHIGIAGQLAILAMLVIELDLSTASCEEYWSDCTQTSSQHGLPVRKEVLRIARLDFPRWVFGISREFVPTPPPFASDPFPGLFDQHDPVLFMTCTAPRAPAKACFTGN